MRTISSDVCGKNACSRRGFTLVELLIVISIIGVLVALTMPAVNSARESARRAQCSNNLHQMALGCLQLESKYGHLPSGGWGWQWAGEPDRGYGAQQPAGWHFNILPFIDQADLHDMGKGVSSSARRAAGAMQAQTPLSIFICPTRHKLQPFPRVSRNDYVNINEPAPIIGRSDYAANSGSNWSDVSGPGGAGNAPNQGYDPAFNWTQIFGTINSGATASNGVIFRASALSMALIKDGASNTYLIGERYLCTDCYNNGVCCDNDQGWDQGYDWDTNRWTTNPPSQDRPGVSGCMNNFGSAHPAGFNMAFCDGVVRKMSYTINPTVHQQLGARADGEPTDGSWINAR